MEIKLISNKDFMELAKLNAKMYNEIGKGTDEFQATNTLVYCINTQQDFKAVGLFEDESLKGFVTGFNGGVDTFYFTGLYMEDKNNPSVKELIEFCFKMVEDLGYKAWEVDANNENIASIVEKYGASMQYIRYRKEL